MSDAQTDMEKATEMAENAAGIGARIGDEFEDTSRPTKAQLEAWLTDTLRVMGQTNTCFLAVRAIARNAQVSEAAAKVAESEARESRAAVCRKYKAVVAGTQAFIEIVEGKVGEHTFRVPIFEDRGLEAHAAAAIEVMAKQRIEDRMNVARLEEARLAHEVSVCVVASSAVNAGRKSCSHGGAK